mmetsp:Transcript_96755/g.288970  ORF Transcript_96755/g.288970 Transcript_96755/m.288970 type:complete len:229 (+) Transcript_96755:33-719(+)
MGLNGDDFAFDRLVDPATARLGHARGPPGLCSAPWAKGWGGAAGTGAWPTSPTPTATRCWWLMGWSQRASRSWCPRSLCCRPCPPGRRLLLAQLVPPRLMRRRSSRLAGESAAAAVASQRAAFPRPAIPARRLLQGVTAQPRTTRRRPAAAAWTCSTFQVGPRRRSKCTRPGLLQTSCALPRHSWQTGTRRMEPGANLEKPTICRACLRPAESHPTGWAGKAAGFLGG